MHFSEAALQSLKILSSLAPVFLTEQFLIKKRVLKGTGGGGNLRVNQADYYETWQMCTSHGPTKTLMETVHIRFSSLPIPWKSQSLGNFLPDDIFPQALSRKCQYRSQLCHVISRQPSRVERQNSPFTKQDNQGHKQHRQKIRRK